MQTRTARRDINAHPSAVARVILNIAELADWNPALTNVDSTDQSARIGHPYSVSTRLPGRSTLTYTLATTERIMWRLDLAGGTEIAEWVLLPRGAVTQVDHNMTHSGPLFTLLRGAMANVPMWRLDRLQERVE